MIKIDPLDLQRQLGTVGREPRWATAWKFPAEQAVTKLHEIQVSGGTNRRTHPVRATRTRLRRRRHRRDGDVAQPVPHPGTRHPRRGRGDRAASRRRDTPGGGTGVVETPGTAVAEIQDANHLPGLRHQRGARPGRRRLLLSEPRMPRENLSHARALHRPRRARYRRVRRGALARAGRTRVHQDLVGSLRATRAGARSCWNSAATAERRWTGCSPTSRQARPSRCIGC